MISVQLYRGLDMCSYLPTRKARNSSYANVLSVGHRVATALVCARCWKPCLLSSS